MGRLVKSIGHLQLGVLMRQVRAERENKPNKTLSVPGYGLHVSGRLEPGWWNDKDDVTFAAYTGKGIGRYITDLGEVGGQDAVYDPASGRLEAVPAFSAYVGYEHWWNDSEWGGDVDMVGLWRPSPSRSVTPRPASRSGR